MRVDRKNFYRLLHDDIAYRLLKPTMDQVDSLVEAGAWIEANDRTFFLIDSSMEPLDEIASEEIREELK